MNQDMKDFVYRFRDGAPYVNVHRGRVFVIYLDGRLMIDEALPGVLGDITLLSSLGIQIVLVTGADVEIDAALKAAGLPAEKVGKWRPTDAEMLAVVQSVAGRQRVRLEAYLSAELPNMPGRNHQQIISGNYAIGRSLGVIDGQDYGLAGAVRRLDEDIIRRHLQSGAIVHLSCLGYSVTGETFNLQSEEVATRAATDLQADKLIFLTQSLVFQEQGEVVSELGLDELSAFAKTLAADDSQQAPYAEALLQALKKNVRRGHLLDYTLDGALLIESFSHQGCGTQVSIRRGDQVRPATLEDISGILAVIKPLEEAGVLVQRDRSLLEQEVDHFRVMEMDGLITGCAALYPMVGTDMGELVCLATHPGYLRRGEGEALLQAIERAACQVGLKKIFVLTTQAADWFSGHGFVAGKLSDLPIERQKLYNFQRGAKVLVKPLLQ